MQADENLEGVQTMCCCTLSTNPKSDNWPCPQIDRGRVAIMDLTNVMGLHHKDVGASRSTDYSNLITDSSHV